MQLHCVHIEQCHTVSGVRTLELEALSCSSDPSPSPSPCEPCNGHSLEYTLPCFHTARHTICVHRSAYTNSHDGYLTAHCTASPFTQVRLWAVADSRLSRRAVRARRSSNSPLPAQPYAASLSAWLLRCTVHNGIRARASLHSTAMRCSRELLMEHGRWMPPTALLSLSSLFIFLLATSLGVLHRTACLSSGRSGIQRGCAASPAMARSRSSSCWSSLSSPSSRRVSSTPSCPHALCRPRTMLRCGGAVPREAPGVRQRCSQPRPCPAAPLLC